MLQLVLHLAVAVLLLEVLLLPQPVWSSLQVLLLQLPLLLHLLLWLRQASCRYLQGKPPPAHPVRLRKPSLQRRGAQQEQQRQEQQQQEKREQH